MKTGDLPKSNIWWRLGGNFWTEDTNLKQARIGLEIKRKPLALSANNVFLLKGPRQCGKTTFIKQQIEWQIQKLNCRPETLIYLSCDFLTTKELRSKLKWFFDTRSPSGSSFIFLDEITSVPDWDVELKWAADVGYLERSCIVATGSNPSKIQRAPEKAPGRKQDILLFKPLSFREYIFWLAQHVASRGMTNERGNFENLAKTLAKQNISLEEDLNTIYKKASEILPFFDQLNLLFEFYLLTGGLPKPMTELLNKYACDGSIQPIQNSTYQDAVKTLIGDLSALELRDETIRQLLAGILNRYGSKYDFSKLSTDVQQSRPTIIKYLSLLEDSMLIQVVYGRDSSKVKYRGDKKIYFTDPFYYHSLDAFSKGGADGYKNSQDNILNEDIKGKILEGVIANHLAVAGEIPYLREKHSFLWYYSDTKKEVDLLVHDKNDQYLGIEVKLGEKEKFPKVDLKKKVMLCKEELELEGNLLYCPYSIFLALLEKSEKHV